MNLSELATPFAADQIEWRIGRCGKKGDKLWATCMAYVDARAVTTRLDEVCGPQGWRMEQPVPLISDNKIVGFMAGISINVDGQWITRWDVADSTDIEAIKGGFSGAVRRCCAQWGIGKYLYRLDEGFAECSESKQNGWHYQPANQNKQLPAFYWQSPKLPAWAMPPTIQGPRHTDRQPAKDAQRQAESGEGNQDYEPQSAPPAARTPWQEVMYSIVECMGIKKNDWKSIDKIIGWLCSDLDATKCYRDPDEAQRVVSAMAEKNMGGMSLEDMPSAAGLLQTAGTP